LLLSTNSAGFAAGGPGGGGHGGGGHAGGGHAGAAGHTGGAAHFSGGVPHAGGANYGGNYGGWYGRGYYPYYNHNRYPYGYPFAFGIGIGFYAPLNYGTFYYPDYYIGPSGSNYLYAPPPDGYSESGPEPSSPPAPASDQSVRVDVRVPVADAEVFFDDSKTSQTGMVRYFESPPLEPGAAYEYTIRARWIADGKPVTQTRKITVFAGQRVGVNFGAPAGRPAR
jgi:uncharacterized protein (TIGR03000 family)